ncbi:endoribonuclease L-PSP [Kiloniella litopenaei]|uniref:Endoribonuclease L-PSP n=1 Tax=Kiloniella litopenaei TaxID=1549748 RepID=A0A0M2RE59_9PROT|nr:RidA family protein [Kiloniella litopenaei]KKJ78295.1 endoribonuclease L-PSP [Kiloniella litopenaei]
MLLERINYPELGLPVGPYTHAVIQGDTLYTSGFTAFGTADQDASIGDQAKAIFSQLKSIAKAQNISLQNLVKVTVFVTDMSDMDALRATLAEIYGEHIPASSLIKIEALFAPELKIEIEAIFAL